MTCVNSSFNVILVIIDININVIIMIIIVFACGTAGQLIQQGDSVYCDV